MPVLGPKYSNPWVAVLVPEKVWCLWPGIRLSGIASDGAWDDGAVAARCCLVVRTSPADDH